MKQNPDPLAYMSGCSQVDIVPNLSWPFSAAPETEDQAIKHEEGWAQGQTVWTAALVEQVG